MDKPVITRNQADRIWAFEWRKKNPSKLLEFHVKHTFSSSKCLQSLSLDELARCLYVGYEVEVEELEPQFEVGDWVNHDDRNIGKITKIKDGIIFIDVPLNHGEYVNTVSKYFKYATPTEIAGEEKSRMDKKINEIWIGLSDYERNGFYRKLVRGEY